MSAEIIRRAASGIRDEWSGQRGGGWHKVQAFHLAVADWLDECAALDDDGRLVDAWGKALTVARAYLGETA